MATSAPIVHKNRPFMNVVSQFSNVPEHYVVTNMISISQVTHTIQSQTSTPAPTGMHKPISIELQKNKKDGGRSEEEIAFLQKLITGSVLSSASLAPLPIPSASSVSPLSACPLSACPLSACPLSACPLSVSPPLAPTETPLTVPVSTHTEEDTNMLHHLKRKFRMGSEYPATEPERYAYAIIETMEPLFTCKDPVEKRTEIHALKVECVSIFKRDNLYAKGPYTPKCFKKVDLDESVDSKRPFTVDLTACIADVCDANFVYIHEVSYGCYDVRMMTYLKTNRVTVLFYEDERGLYSFVPMSRNGMLTAQEVIPLVESQFQYEKSLPMLQKRKVPELQNLCKWYGIPVKKQGRTENAWVARTADELANDLMKN